MINSKPVATPMDRFYNDNVTQNTEAAENGSVQLHRSIGLRDEYVMQRVQMVGRNAYVNYCEAYNDCAPEDLPALQAKKSIYNMLRVRKRRRKPYLLTRVLRSF